MRIEIDAAPVVNYAMQQNDAPVVRGVRITNDSPDRRRDLALTLSITGDLCEPLTLRLGELAPGASHLFAPIDLALKPDRLVAQVERELVELRITVSAAPSEEVGSAGHRLELLAFNEWPGIAVLPEILGAFITPNHPANEPVLARARDFLSRATGDAALSGYQSGRPERTRAMVQALAAAFRALDIGYINPPASYEHTGQKVRTADQVLDGRLGTCLDLSTTLAGLLEQSGLNPIIILFKEHAAVGVWTLDDSFPEPCIEDRARILKRVQLGQLILLESTGLVAGSRLNFAAVHRAAEQRLELPDDFIAAIDIKAARRARIRPLPSRLSDSFTVVEPAPVPDNPIQVEPLRPPTPTRTHRTRTAAAAPGLSPSAQQRLDTWKRKLLDLSLRNRLLNFRPTKRTIPLLAPNLARLEDALFENDSLALHPRPAALDSPARDPAAESRRTGEDPVAALLREHLASGRLCADLTETDLAARALELFRAARTGLEESGSNTLYLALGSLVWYESESSDRPLRAPLVLLPAELRRNAAARTFALHLTDEDARVNVTLLELLRSQFAIDTTGLDLLPEDQSGLDIDAVMHAFTDRIKDTPRWEVQRTAHLSLFSFAKFVMWADLESRADQLVKNKVVLHLLDREKPSPGLGADDLEPAEPLDALRGEAAAICPMDADSSQVVAVEAALRARSFVLQGPPGTGKSQTITNIIAKAMASGKRVLFVAEKMAALSVVKHRLDRLGLGVHCLELHSAKSGKKEVLAQLQQALEAPHAAEPANWPAEVESLERSRADLNGYVGALHSRRPFGDSAFGIMSRFCRFAESPVIELALAEPDKLPEDRLRTLREAVAALAATAAAIGDPGSHPLRGIGIGAWSFTLEDDIRRAVGALERELAPTSAALAGALPRLGGGSLDKLSFAELAWLLRAAKLALADRASTEALITAPNWSADKPALEAAIARGRRRDAERTDLLTRWRKTFLTLDHAGLAAESDRIDAQILPVRFFLRRGLRRRLLEHCKAKPPFGPALVADLKLAQSVAQATAELTPPQSPGARHFGPDWNAGEADWARLAALLAWADSLRAALAAAPPARGLTDAARSSLAALACSDAPRHPIEAFTRAATAFGAALKSLGQTVAIQPARIAADDDEAFLPRLREALSRWVANLALLPDWCAWRREASRDLPELAPLIEAMSDSRLAHEHASAAFERAFARAVLGALFVGEPTFARFAAAQHSNRVEEFRTHDRRIIDLSRAVVHARARKQGPTALVGAVNPESEVGILKRQCALKARHMPVRRLIQRLPNLIPRLKPCWLMSPLSVAQYLDPALPPFDIIIFDEASQIPPWDAVGALARGSDAVIVGDSRQLPPTSFFMKQEDEEAADEADIEEVESILDEAVASNVPALRLLWHYRSRHESLIAFSNYHYYDNRLLTFPGPHERADGLGVSLRHFENGLYDRRNSRTNRVEADAVVAEVVRRLGEPGAAQRSYGIVTFSQAQQYLIEDLLDEERRRRPEIERFFTAVEEPVFIKNLENVQGDERDVILFSICYGTDDRGRITMNFGPLNREGGERRLNVAITRARREVVVFSSLRADQIDLSRTRAVGVAHLRAFIDYAARGPRAILEAVTDTGEPESPFEESVRRALEARGWQIDAQVGCSGYRIDLAVKDHSCPGRYLLGIECDGAMYHSARSARDRDRLREQVLRGLGWRLHRVWSTDWIQSRDRALARIEEAIRDAERAAPHPEPIPTPTSAPTQPTGPARIAGLAAPAAVVAPTLGAPYTRHAFKQGRRTPEAFFQSPDVVADLRAIVETEAPIHRELLLVRLADAWGIQRITSRCHDRLNELLAAAAIPSTDDILWRRAEDPAHYRDFRTPAPNDPGARDFEHIPLPELANAAAAILAAQISLPEPALARELARLYTQRLTPRTEPRLAAAISLLLSTSRATRNADSIAAI